MLSPFILHIKATFCSRMPSHSKGREGAAAPVAAAPLHKGIIKDLAMESIDGLSTIDAR